MGRRSVWKRPKRKHSKWKDPYEMLNGAKPLSNNNSWAKEGQEKPKTEPVKLERSPTKTTLIRTEPYKVLTRTTKPLRRRILVEEGLAKSSKKNSTRRTQTSGIFAKQVVFHTVNHRGPLPLKELHSTGETIVWRDPGGSWACLPPVHKCNHPTTVCDMCGIHPKQHTKKRGALGNTKKTKTTKRRPGMSVEEVYENDPKESIQNERSPMKCYMEQNH